MKTKAVAGAVLLVLLICMLFLGVSTLPVSAGYYYQKFTTVDGGSHNHGGSGSPGGSDSGIDINKKWLQIKASIGDSGSYWAEAWLYKDFTYTHTHDEYNWIELKYYIYGMMYLAGADLDCLCRITATIRDVTQGVDLKTVTDVEKVLSMWGDPQPWSPDEHRTVKLQESLINGHSYRVNLTVYGVCSTSSPGASFIRFFATPEEEWRLEWEWLIIRHSQGGTFVYGGQSTGVEVQGEWYVEQTSYANADGLNFTSYNKKCDINGWRIDIWDFTGSNSWRDGNRAVDVEASGVTIPRDSAILVQAKQWLKSEDACPNSMGLRDVKWQDAGSGSEEQALPNHHWSFDYPIPFSERPGYFLHWFTLTNDDTQRVLKVTALSYQSTTTQYAYLGEIGYTGPTLDLSLSPGQSHTVPVITLGTLYGGYIYFKYSIYNQAGDQVVCNAWGEHLVTSASTSGGGIIVPVDKFGLLAPYIGLASTVLVATVATVVFIKRVKSRKEKK